MNNDKLKKMSSDVRTGGKGTMRRKKKVTHHLPGGDDKKVQAKAKQLGVQAMPGIDEVSFWREDGTILQFKNPKLQANFNSNTFVLSGKSEEKNILPSLLQQYGGLANPETFQKKEEGAKMEDDGVPDLEAPAESK